MKGFYEDNIDPTKYIRNISGTTFPLTCIDTTSVKNFKEKVFKKAKIKWNLNKNISTKNIQLFCYNVDQIKMKRLKYDKKTIDSQWNARWRLNYTLVLISKNNINIFQKNDKIYRLYIENTYLNEYIVSGYIKEYITMNHIPNLVLYKIADHVYIEQLMENRFKYIGNIILNKRDSMDICKDRIYRKFGRQVPKPEFIRLRQISKTGNKYGKCYYDDKLLMDNESIDIRKQSFTKIGIQKLFRKEYLNNNTMFVKVCQYYTTKNVVGPVNELPFNKSQTISSFYNDLCSINDIDRLRLQFIKVNQYVVNNSKYYDDLKHNKPNWIPRYIQGSRKIKFYFWDDYNDWRMDIEHELLKNFYKNGGVIVFKEVSSPLNKPKMRNYFYGFP